MNNDSVKQIWEDFKEVYPDTPEEFQTWVFGDSKEDADELVTLVLEGTKTATSSSYSLYGNNETLPYVGLHNIILDGTGKAVAIIETTSIEIVPFEEVTEEHAYLEGEGDRSLNHWRAVHKNFFTKELNGINQDFDHKMLVVCERFKLIFRN
jgi:uncharacterized protein YhfF